ncbi:GTP-sensing transcriptional pleiotropic repressor CodY [Xylanibacillus composti]|uniref:Global transcriptional regulator CodY n=1 Tax=Xylanibacillus composti TaxID=1572762 RepID=A0A8J4H349_9BACL|nr:GTP-sensing pleiotropic transcriptional regulator CodY [Xylanibacillus composti]GIQ68651.1 GTP-sensing transcriptional pleiotropic repressor CodY [Xylanibacillus composti]
MSLLSKTRRLNRMLQKAAGQAVNFMEVAEVLKDTIRANVYVVSRKGKILGYSVITPIISEPVRQMIVEDRQLIPELNEKLLAIRETTTNSGMDPEAGGEQWRQELTRVFEDKMMTVVPVMGAGSRQGTLLLVRFNEAFVDDDLILAEYGSTIIAMEILRERTERMEQDARNKAVVHVAVESLSFSELEAVEHIFGELEGPDGLLVASKIADRAGITRSVIVNALRKLESAGVIETRSLGMKGTYIKVLNEYLTDEIARAKA